MNMRAMKFRVLFAMILIAIWIVLVYPGSAQDKASKSIQNKGDNRQSITAPPLPPPKQPEEGQTSTTPTTTKASDREDRKVRISGPVDIKSGKDSWDRSLVIFTAALVIVGIFQILFLWRTVVATSDNAKAAKLAAQAVISSERPWLTARSVTV
jgi:hypothetical protein